MESARSGHRKRNCNSGTFRHSPDNLIRSAEWPSGEEYSLVNLWLLNQADVQEKFTEQCLRAD